MAFPKDIYHPEFFDFDLERNSCQQGALEMIELALGNIEKVEILSGGLVHYVYRVVGEKETGIAKIRGSNFSRLPNIAINPEDIIYEWKAIILLSSLEPTIFPHPLGFDQETSMILMTDVVPERKTLEDQLNEKTIGFQDMMLLGKTVASVHRKLQPLQMSMRDGDDDNIYGANLFYVLGFLNNPVLNETINQLQQLPKQLILAEMSPKNISLGENGKVKMYDLDSFYRGHLAFALAYLTAHILIHNLDDNLRASTLIEGLLKGCQLELPGLEVNDPLFKRIVLGSAVYRLDNPVVPYRLLLTEEERLEKANSALELLNFENMEWSELIQNMTK